MDAIAAARTVVDEHHPDARAAFLGGSVVTGRRTAMSDLDIVVLLHGAPAPYRASFRHDDWPVELFVHTEATWYAYVEREVRKRRSPLLWMCAAGLLLFDTDGLPTSPAMPQAQRTTYRKGFFSRVVGSVTRGLQGGELLVPQPIGSPVHSGRSRSTPRGC